jgi:DnaJ-class molecular chaperone
MSDQNPYEKLGVTEDASFDEIQDAKVRLMQQHRGDQKLLDAVEAAYDAVIMDRLRMRQDRVLPKPQSAGLLPGFNGFWILPVREI